MTERKKKGIGLFVSGFIFVIAGAFMIWSGQTPDWVGSLIAVIGMIAEALGFKLVFPDEDE